jgi:ABC-type Fe2+-enterobactin transport system substrate-binding protein
MITPELFSDRGVAWCKAIFDICNTVISNFGVLALAAIAVWQNIVSKAKLTERLDRQSARIESNAQTIAAVALATPVATAKVEVVSPPEKPVQVEEIK